jgi:hypothetical protein
MSLDTTTKLDQLSRKRAALEQLLLLAHQLSRMQGGIGTLQQMLKPSQAPGRKTSAIEQLGAQLTQHTSAQLQQQLAALDAVIARELSSVVVLSRLTRAEFIQRYCESKGAADAAALLENQLENFRRNGQLNVAIRYVLHSRGVQIKAAELPISQEAVAQRIAALRGEEQQCRQQLTEQAQDLVAALELELADPATPPDIKLQHRATKKNLEQTLQVLASGRSLEELPLQLDMPVESSPNTAFATPAGATGDSSAAPPLAPRNKQGVPHNRRSTSPGNPIASQKKPPRGFWQKLRLWLNTPWKTRWKDLGNS